MLNNVKQWLGSANVDQEVKNQINAFSQDELKDAFYKNIEFGTAGMRGIIRPGTNGMNVYNIRKANTAFAKVLLANTDVKNSGVAIAYDNRNMSKEFAMECAAVFATHGITSYLFEALRPTPELSFTVRHLKLAGGVVITASHNPPEYNGYKIYDANGCQYTEELIKPVIEAIAGLKEGFDIEALSFEQALEKGLVKTIGKELDDAYINAVLDMQINKGQKNLVKTLFSSQHGTAIQIAPALFKAAGYNVDIVEKQCIISSTFENTKSPNPEDPAAYDLLIKDGIAGNYDLLLTTDPDADRVGFAVMHNGEYKLISGNQGGAILLEYVLGQYKQLGKMPNNPVMINTIVTSDLGDLVAKKYGVEVEKTLTGFKFIGDKIAKYEKNGLKNYVFGYEESFGYLIDGSIARDKDSFQAMILLVEAANFYKAQGKSLYDVLQDIYKEHGYFKEVSESITLKGQEGLEKINKAMESISAIDDNKWIGMTMKCVENFRTGVSFTNFCGQITRGEIAIPKTNAIKFYMDDAWVAIRPSGTEPKLKVYYCIRRDSINECESTYKAIKEKISTFFKGFDINY